MWTKIKQFLRELKPRKPQTITRITDEIIDELHTVADELEGHLPAEDISFFRENLKYSEVGIGMEILLEQIYEAEPEIILSKRAYDILKNAGKGNIDDSYFDGIQHSEE